AGLSLDGVTLLVLARSRAGLARRQCRSSPRRTPHETLTSTGASREEHRHQPRSHLDEPLASQQHLRRLAGEVKRCGEVVDRAAAPTGAEAVPAALRGLVDMQACMPVLVERARHLAMARHF